MIKNNLLEIIRKKSPDTNSAMAEFVSVWRLDRIISLVLFFIWFTQSKRFNTFI
jgi:hypothetical protein